MLSSIKVHCFAGFCHHHHYFGDHECTYACVSLYFVWMWNENRFVNHHFMIIIVLLYGHKEQQSSRLFSKTIIDIFNYCFIIAYVVKGQSLTRDYVSILRWQMGTCKTKTTQVQVACPSNFIISVQYVSLYGNWKMWKWNSISYELLIMNYLILCIKGTMRLCSFVIKIFKH